jgi:DNA-binding response OmpR family regulator
MQSRVLIIEDDPHIASALVRGLELQGYAPVSENRADRAQRLLKTEAFSSVIVDVMLGADSGIELVREVRAAGIDVPILMLSALADVEHRAAGLEAGADDYVVKPFQFDELVARLRVQERRAGNGRSDIVRLSLENRTLEMATESVALTDREFELLSLLVQHAGTPLPR